MSARRMLLYLVNNKFLYASVFGANRWPLKPTIKVSEIIYDKTRKQRTLQYKTEDRRQKIEVSQ